MQVYHFSVRFEGSDMSYHGEFLMNSVVREEIIYKAKQKLTEKLPMWKREGRDVISFDVYRFDDEGRELSVFNFEK